MQKPRSIYTFPVRLPGEGENYVPPKTFIPELRLAYEQGGRGIVIAREQRVGMTALAATYEKILAEGNAENLSQVSGLFASTLFGTSYYLFSQGNEGKAMYRNVKLPKLYDEETDEVLDQDGMLEVLNDNIRKQIRSGSYLARNLEINPNRSMPEANNIRLRLGRGLASASLSLGAISNEIYEFNLNEPHEIQYLAWSAAGSVHMNSLNLMSRTGVLPTLAQISNENSPLRRDLVDNPEEVIGDEVHMALLKEVEKASKI